MSWEHWLGFGLTVVLLILSLGKMWGVLQERSELRDWREWRTHVDAWINKRERAVDARFEDANHLLSKLTSDVQSLPTRIMDQSDDRYMDRRGCEAEIRGLNRRMEIMEQRMARYNGAPRGPADV